MTDKPVVSAEDREAAAVLGTIAGGRWDQASRHVCGGGFSGARVWRVVPRDAQANPSQWGVLRRWPRDYPIGRIGAVHQLLFWARARGLECVPKPHLGINGQSVWTVRESGWDFCSWCVGDSIPPGQGTAAQWAAAGRTLAQWHALFDETLPPVDLLELGSRDCVDAFRGRRPMPSPGMRRRRTEWLRLWPAMAKIRSVEPTVRDLALRTASAVARLQGRMEETLRTIESQRADTIPTLCLRDVHRQHLLFTGATVTGLIDFAAIGFDHPSADIGRLLGSLVPDDPIGWQAALAGYRAVRPLADEQAQWSWWFDWTGLLIAALHWLEWMGAGRRSFDDPSAAVARWREVLGRLEQIADRGGPEKFY